MSTGPRWRSVPLAPRLSVAPDSGRRALSLPALTGTTDWRRRLADRAGALVVGVVGAGALPTQPPVDWPPCGLSELASALHDSLPTLRLAGAVLPRQSGRARLSLLGRMTGNTVVVKVGRVGEGIEHETWALRRLAERPLPGIATPVPLADGTIELVDGEEMAYLVTFGVSVRRQRPAVGEALRTFEADLGRSLADLPRSTDVPSDHVPIHGDLAPYNLRRTPRGLALFDWEGTRWGPPGSDVEMYRRRCELIRRGEPIPPPDELLEQL